MKTFGNILKVLAALATIVGAIYVIIKYGDKIVAWTKQTFGKYFPCCCCCCEECEEIEVEDESVVEESAPVADEDFEAVE